jgi:hypothetical protein
MISTAARRQIAKAALPDDIGITPYRYLLLSEPVNVTGQRARSRLAPRLGTGSNFIVAARFVCVWQKAIADLLREQIAGLFVL